MTAYLEPFFVSHLFTPVKAKKIISVSFNLDLTSLDTNAQRFACRGERVSDERVSKMAEDKTTKQ